MKNTELQSNGAGDVGLLQERLHKLLDTMSDKQVEELIPYLTWILEIPYSS